MVNFFRNRNVNKKKQSVINHRENIELSGFLNESLQENVQTLKNRLGKNTDFLVNDLVCKEWQATLLFYKSLVDVQLLTERVVSPLKEQWDAKLQQVVACEQVQTTVSDPLAEIKRCIVLSDTQLVNDWHCAVDELLDGKVLLLVDGVAVGLAIGLAKVEKRDISPPETELSVIGPRESFVEILGPNITLIRQRLRDPHLYIESFQVGKRGKQEVALFYLDDVANPALVEEVKRRVMSIEVGALQGQLHLQELLEDNTYSLFPQMRPSERPDVVCSYLLEGSVVLMVEGAAHALIMPITFYQLITTIDDYYSSWQYATLIRLVRMVALLFSIATPGFYLSLIAYNPELIPTRLVISMDAARVKVALPIVLEVFIMEIMIEILREAGIKLPKPVGQAVSIIGGLVIGEAAVNANLVSPVTVVIVALTAISSFTAPVYLLGITYRILRFFLLLCSSIFGLYGFLLGLFIIHAHASRLVSFGVPYLAPLSPLRIRDWMDTVLRFSFKRLIHRPTFLASQNPTKAQPLAMTSKNQRKE
ncbi:spore germination protein [Brevibacillus migulae]|uniref:spore germination protein n=1 Tax=Brevibacillus migulae TaxID=1644114 RepID=UPI00106E65FB|nr:spore germination protein [Brevibacillus migulae]